MQTLEFPNELTVFTNLFSKKQIEELEIQFSKNIDDSFVPSLTDWKKQIYSLLKKGEFSSIEMLTVYSKLAWIQCDLAFFARFKDKITEIKPTPLLYGYLGVGMAEFFDLEDGLTLIQTAMKLALENKDQEALLDLATPYALILNNNGEATLLEQLLQILSEEFGETIYSDKRVNALLSPAFFFGMDKASKKIKLDAKTSLSNTLEQGLNLHSALMYTFLSKLDKESDSYNHYIEEAIKYLEKIDARNRIIIANTNLASHFAMKNQYEKSKKLFRKAVSLAKEIEENYNYISGLLLYPYISWGSVYKERGELQKAKEMFILTLKHAIESNNLQYQSKAESSLAYINFLQNDDEQALNHAANLRKLINQTKSNEKKNSLMLHYTELLIDLKKVDEIPALFSSIDESGLSPCLQVYHKYIQGRFELNRFNVGNAKKYLSEGLENTEHCPHMKPPILFAMSESNLHEYRLSENFNSLKEAEKAVRKVLKEVSDIPNRSKGEFLLSLILCAQGRYEEAEEILEPFFRSSLSIPRFKSLAEKVLDDIRDQRVSTTPVSPISNVRDVLRYLREAKDVIHSEPR